jgi:hypothetical protein
VSSLTSPHPRPLRWHLLWLVVGVLLPAVVFGGVLLFQLARSERAAVERRLLQSARSLSEAFDREMSGSIRTLQALGQSTHLEDGDLASFHGEALRVLRTQPTWRNVILATPDGVNRVATVVPWGTAPPPRPRAPRPCGPPTRRTPSSRCSATSSEIRSPPS